MTESCSHSCSNSVHTYIQGTFGVGLIGALTLASLWPVSQLPILSWSMHCLLSEVKALYLGLPDYKSPASIPLNF